VARGGRVELEDGEVDGWASTFSGKILIELLGSCEEST
jgi:hypothetical protein